LFRAGVEYFEPPQKLDQRAIRVCGLIEAARFEIGQEVHHAGISHKCSAAQRRVNDMPVLFQRYGE
jgi:hypothetical protein